MTSIVLKAQTREVVGRKKVNKLREQSQIPAVLYGHGLKNINLSLPFGDFKKVLEKTGSGKLIDLQIDEKKPVKILIHEVQYDALKNIPSHIDLYQIKEGEKIKTEIELEFIGEAPAVKELSGVLVKNYDEVEIECLPSELEKLDKIQVDLSSLKTFEDVIHIKDLHVPAGIKILVDPTEAVVMVEQIAEEKFEEAKPIESVEGIVKEEKTEEGEAEKEGAKKEGNKKE